MEEEALSTILRPLKREKLCVMHDGAVFPLPTVESLLGIKRGCVQIGREMGIVIIGEMADHPI